MKTNTFGWTGLILSLLSILTSCKKEENKAPIGATPTTSSISTLVGKYANTDMNGYTRDTIYIYHDGSDYKMWCPDCNAFPTMDTIGITIDSMDITIPTQVIYGSAFTINGYGAQVLSNQINLTWTTPSYTVTDAIYIKQ